MRISVGKSEIRGKVRAPSSKSYTIRGLMCAALAGGLSLLQDPLGSDDTAAALRVLRQIGVQAYLDQDTWHIVGDSFHQPDGELFCSESAATLRFMTAICALVPGSSILTAAPSLAGRPLEPLVRSLQQLEVNISLHNGSVIVQGGGIKGGNTELPGNISSQFVSALLLVAPLAQGDIRIKLTSPLESQPYVLMTMECLQKFGVEVNASEDLMEFQVCPQQFKPAKYMVEGDWSSASYLLALGAVTGEVEVENLNLDTLQGDMAILDFLQCMGASVEGGDNTVLVQRRNLNAIEADLTDCIDLLPTVAVVAALADGTSIFNGIRRARIKESNRVSALREGLEKAGIKIVEEENRLMITGSRPQAAVIDAHNDHRIAMAFSILGAAAGDIIIEGAECVSKTFPEYWKVLKSRGGKIDEQ